MKSKKILDKLLDEMVEKGGSDLHIKNAICAKYRVDGEIESMSDEPLGDLFFDDIIANILNSNERQKFIEEKQLDGHYINESGIRFRFNLFSHLNGYAFVFRVIATEIMSLEELELPDAVQKCVDMKRGLVLVTGTTGSGKSTTLAAIIDAINKKRKHHIITIEDPIEFVHTEKNCIIEQRNIGEHASSFHGALKAALREDPDIILVGEMRDFQTIETALHAANTGHLVFSTLHTMDAKETIDRIVGIFPSYEQNRIRMTLASVLQSVISQRLIKKINGGRKAVTELLFTTQRIKQLIAEGRDAEISNAMEEGSIHGMQNFNQALFKLYKEKEVSLDDVLAESSSPNNLLLMIKNSEKHNTSQASFELKLETEELIHGEKPKAKLEPLKLNIQR